MTLSRLNESIYTKVYGVDSMGNTVFKGNVKVPTERISAKCTFFHKRYNPKLDVSKKAIKKLKNFKKEQRNKTKVDKLMIVTEFFKRVDREFIDKIEEMQTSW